MNKNIKSHFDTILRGWVAKHYATFAKWGSIDAFDWGILTETLFDTLTKGIFPLYKTLEPENDSITELRLNAFEHEMRLVVPELNKKVHKGVCYADLVKHLTNYLRDHFEKYIQWDYFVTEEADNAPYITFKIARIGEVFKKTFTIKL